MPVCEITELRVACVIGWERNGFDARLPCQCNLVPYNPQGSGVPVSIENSRIIYGAPMANGVRLISVLPETWLVHLPSRPSFC
jgi:hypothetical protein